MTRYDYIHEVDGLTAPASLRKKVASLPEKRAGLEPAPTKRRRWAGIAAALVLVVGLGVAAPGILRAMAPQGGEVDPPVASVSDPEGIVAEGIDVSPVILDAAKEYVREQYDHFVELHGERSGVPIPATYDNWRIEGLAAVYDRKELGEYTVAVYRLDYRLHTTTPEIVRGYLVGGMDLDEEGWLLPTYPESTYLVFILNYSTNHYFATMINDCRPGSELFDETLAMDMNAYIAGLDEDANPWGIQLSAENITPTGLTLVCQQSGGQPTGELMTGRPFWIERYTNGQWSAVETVLPEDKIVWTMEGWSIPMRGAQKWPVVWDSLYGALSSGEYRIAKTISDHRSPGDYDERVYYAEFTIAREIQGIAIDALDYAKLEEQMDAGDWTALQEYLPVLRNGAAFQWVPEEGVTGGGGSDVTLEEYYDQRFGPDLPDGKLDLERFTLFGFAGTGKQDLVLCFFNGGGHYLILHREGEQFYGFERGYRSFLGLQRDGVYTGSSGADYNSYHRIQFHAGFYEEELLGQRSGEDHEIGGIPVSGEYFWTWRQNLMVGDMDWYYPAQPTGRKPPPSTEDERRWHVSISGLPLEAPFDELPEGLRATLGEPVAEEDLAVTQPNLVFPWIMRTYRSPSLEVQTLSVRPELLNETLAEGGITPEEYEQYLLAEYIYTARPLDRTYATGDGLRLGDSVERARALFYSLPDTGQETINHILANLTVTTEDGVVTGLRSCSGGRTVGSFTS